MTASLRILVIDDEPQIHRFLRPALEASGFQPERAATASEGIHLAGTCNPAVILLDLGLPDMDGQEALQRIRATSRTPIIVLSARDEEAEKVRALDGGADDYVEKPFGVTELMARIRAALRHTPPDSEESEPFSHGGLEVDPVRRSVRADGATVRLSPREYALLLLLVRYAGQVVPHRQLLTGVWGPTHAEDVQYLRVYVGHLRQKLSRAGRLVVTEPGVGYRLLDGK